MPSIGVTLRDGPLEPVGVLLDASLSRLKSRRATFPPALPSAQCRNLPHEDSEASASAFSDRLFSNASRYRSYDSRKCLSTREVNINSPRGLVDGGIGGIVVVRLLVPRGEPSGLPRVMGSTGGELSGLALGRMRLSGQGALGGGVRTLRYMLNDRSALLA